MFNEVDKHIESDTLIVEFRMSALPNLYKQFVQLINYLVIFQNYFMQILYILFLYDNLVCLSKSYQVIWIIAAG